MLITDECKTCALWDIKDECCDLLIERSKEEEDRIIEVCEGYIEADSLSKLKKAENLRPYR